MLLIFLEDLPDHRRAQGRRHELRYIILFSILAIMSNARSYRDIQRFIKVNYVLLRHYFNLEWKKIPSYSTARNIIIGLEDGELEACFRGSPTYKEGTEMIGIAGDGKVLRGSFDHFNDNQAELNRNCSDVNRLTPPSDTFEAKEETDRNRIEQRKVSVDLQQKTGQK